MGINWLHLFLWIVAFIYYSTNYDAVKINSEFCKVEIFCFLGEANWLGQIVGTSILFLTFFFFLKS